MFYRYAHARVHIPCNLFLAAHYCALQFANSLLLQITTCNSLLIIAAHFQLLILCCYCNVAYLLPVAHCTFSATIEVLSILCCSFVLTPSNYCSFSATIGAQSTMGGSALPWLVADG